tara:strand:- start:374 stop:919 length:546 start_codon:yes stop_codon:yes gene_type:complete
MHSALHTTASLLLAATAASAFVAPSALRTPLGTPLVTVKAQSFWDIITNPGAVPPGHATVSHIIFLTADDAEAKATALRDRIDAGEVSFGEAALRFSACPTRDLKGYIGTFTSLSAVGSIALMGTLPYEGQDCTSFDELVFDESTPLNVPQIVQTQWGTHIVLVEARGEPLPRTSGAGADG